MEAKERRLPFVILSTGWGATSTWDHRTAMDLDGRVFPVVASFNTGYTNSRFKFQIVPIGRPFVLATSRRWAGETPTDEIQIVQFPAEIPRENARIREIFPEDIHVMAVASTREELEGLRKKFPGLRPEAIWPVFVQVHRWGPGRACHYPPGIEDVTPLHLSAWGIAPGTLEEALQVLKELISVFNGEMRFFIDPGPSVEVRPVRVASGLSSPGRFLFPPIRDVPRSADRIRLPEVEIRFSPPVTMLAESRDPIETTLAWHGIFWSPGPVKVALRSQEEEKGESLPAGFGEIRVRRRK